MMKTIKFEFYMFVADEMVEPDDQEEQEEMYIDNYIDEADSVEDDEQEYEYWSSMGLKERFPSFLELNLNTQTLA
jgi:hypothetical protein